MTHLIGTVLVHPDDFPGDPKARRIIARAVTPGEWPWTRITGAAFDIPKQGSDLRHWKEQHLGDFALVCGHRTVLVGHEVIG
jgi:hypothetical protein